jgi:hypothetical protein
LEALDFARQRCEIRRVGSPMQPLPYRLQV